jgi:hypothetical protein
LSLNNFVATHIITVDTANHVFLKGVTIFEHNKDAKITGSFTPDAAIYLANIITREIHDVTVTSSTSTNNAIALLLADPNSSLASYSGSVNYSHLMLNSRPKFETWLLKTIMVLQLMPQV